MINVQNIKCTGVGEVEGKNSIVNPLHNQWNSEVKSEGNNISCETTDIVTLKEKNFENNSISTQVEYIQTRKKVINSDKVKDKVNENLFHNHQSSDVVEIDDLSNNWVLLDKCIKLNRNWCWEHHKEKQTAIINEIEFVVINEKNMLIEMPFGKRIAILLASGVSPHIGG